MIDKVKKTELWQELATNSKFVEEFELCVKRCLYNVSMNDLIFEIRDNKLVVYYNSSIKNRDLDCQYKIFDKTEFYLDEDGNIVVNKLNGRLESNYGYDFVTTKGGVVNTHYMCQVYGSNGIELDYQSYSDKYHIDSEEFDAFKYDLRTVIEEAYNPNLSSYANVTGVYPRPNIIGNEARFTRQIRSKDSLGIVEVSKCSFTPDARINDVKEEYYFNTFFTSTARNNPELIHIINGFPFAAIVNNEVVIGNDYSKLGLTYNNFRDVARDRFLKELLESKGTTQDNEVLPKYDLMINELENEKRHEKRMN